MLVDQHDRPIQKLKRGETKALNCQRVVYVRGSDQEAQVIRDIFAWFTRDRMSMKGIAERLTNMKIPAGDRDVWRSEEHTSELQSLMRISYAVFCLKKKKSVESIRTHKKRTVNNI